MNSPPRTTLRAGPKNAGGAVPLPAAADAPPPDPSDPLRAIPGTKIAGAGLSRHGNQAANTPIDAAAQRDPLPDPMLTEAQPAEIAQVEDTVTDEGADSGAGMHLITEDAPQTPQDASGAAKDPAPELSAVPPAPTPQRTAHDVAVLDAKLAAFEAGLRGEFAGQWAILSDQVQTQIATAFAASEPTLVDRVGAAIYERIRLHVEGLHAATDKSLAELTRQIHGVELPRLRAQASGERTPEVVFHQLRPRLEYPPVVLPDGSISLLYNHDPQGGHPTAELRLPHSGGSHKIKFGYSVTIPDGYFAEVTVRGLHDQRFQIATLYGGGRRDAELQLAIHTNAPGNVVATGQEIARLHLRRNTPATCRWVER